VRLKEGELIGPHELKQVLSKHLDTLGNVSIQAPLLEYHVSDKYMEVLKVEKNEDGKFVYHLPKSYSIESFAHNVHTSLRGKKHKVIDTVEIKINIEGWIRDGLLRSGLCRHANLKEDVMRFIKSYDDVILAPDTNILLDCIITSILLPEIEEEINEELKGCPNWILIAIPKLVMNEVERKAIKKYHRTEFLAKAGWPKYDGRIGQRALQEILELDTNIKYRGVSIMTIGEIPSTFNSFKNDQTRWDSEIRLQVRDFISKISFHKGAFFITQDRVNAMMARAEGLQSLYLQKPEYKDLMNKELENEDAARVLYEMAVTFGDIIVEGVGKLSIFWPGKHVGDWEKSRVMVTEVF